MTKKAITVRRVVLALLVLYALAMLFLLIFPNFYRGHMVLVGGLTWERWLGYIRNAFNFVPLRSLSQQIGSIVSGQAGARGIIYLAGNLVGFAPLGFFLPALFARQRKFPAFLITVLLAIALLELTQALAMRGTCDIDDLILNAAGACAGFFAARKGIRRNEFLTHERNPL